MPSSHPIQRKHFELKHMKQLRSIAHPVIAGVLTLLFAAYNVGGAPETAITAETALARLKAGNARFVSGKSQHPNQDAARRLEIAKGQTPFVTVLSCSDSRVPVELLFDQGIGDTFVVRVAGNVADTDEIGSIEYGAGHLNTPLLVVLGHTSCGAVKAVFEKAQVHGCIPELVDNIAPAISRTKAGNPDAPAAELLAKAVTANVWVSIEDIFRRSPEVGELVKASKLRVMGAVYNIQSGHVTWLGEHPEQISLFTQSERAEHDAPPSAHNASLPPAKKEATHAAPSAPAHKP
jgi:carbonic anhydrase